MPKRRVVLAAMAAGAAMALAAPAGAAVPSNDDLFNRLQREKGDVILVGNSMQGKGLDFNALTARTGVRVSDAGFGGAMSIWQYAVVKYMIPKLEKKPKVVVVVERMNYFTCPQRRATEYRSRSKAMADDAGWALMNRLAIKGEGQPAWQKEWNNDIVPPDSYWWDFEKSVKTSFLPYMIEAAKENGFQLAIARHKARIFAEQPDWNPPQVAKYGEDMAAYLQANGVIFLDYDGHPAIKAEHYSNGDHLNETGRAICTALMAKDLKAILEGNVAPNQHLPSKAVNPQVPKDAAATQPASRPADEPAADAGQASAAEAAK